ncbi:ATP-dependent Clp protease proteolytic subunit [Agathobacter rectalis]|uniref:ATP-dependent Clp protease proteolytic subunit n=1 Tax=Agathobacter rectalis TaxID=39491 RepID=A0A414IQH5_9FIRM|nr:ATP-dependent Clp protease proteolytic subunit [Agathobacter rectalis]RGT07968.1 ATP-dependent Clp protease proteolytic subunit [Agathobacter rectalis]RGT15842.1 ATP-dependent Clp protease proteolytic subunit [Agathobacter rectalis]RHE30680.1 ATP-dependent Clp protease proteolytic subunit [Agathobacter rectalis]
MSQILQKSNNGTTQVSLDAKLLNQRMLFIEGEITNDIAIEFAKKILYLNMESTKPIKVFVNSCGGETTAGLLMIDAIVGSKAEVTTICLGKAYSMAAVLFLSANRRLILTNSEIMIHEVFLNGNINANLNNIKNLTDSLMKTREKLNSIISEHTNHSIKEIETAISFDHYFSAQEALEFGIADEIIEFSQCMEG